MKKVFVALIIAIGVIPFGFMLFEEFRPLAENISYRGNERAGRVHFLKDLTYQNEFGEKATEQVIFSETFQMIDEAEDFILLDMFLYNDDYDHRLADTYPPLSQNLTNRLVAKKKQFPHMPIILITDPINFGYGAYVPSQMQALRDVGVDVVITDLDVVKDSNPIYSAGYRAYWHRVPNKGPGRLPNLFDGQKDKMTGPSYLRLLNFKANHRKVVITEKAGLIMSANPHDGSAYHSNIAFRLEGDILQDLLIAEQSVLHFSDRLIGEAARNFKIQSDKKSSDLSFRFVTEGKIKEEILQIIQGAEEGERLMLGLFYLSERDVIKALKEASQKGVNVDIILDLNKDAFGKKKIGIPNKPVAAELTKEKNINVRWYETQGEQYHSKFLFYQGKEKGALIGGSANFTRRNLGDLNLEADLVVRGSVQDPEMQKAYAYFKRIWENEEGIYTADYESHQENKMWKYVIYRFQEASGLSTF